MQYLMVQQLPECKDYERTTINVYEFAMAIRKWLRQMRVHNAYYRNMASLPAASASSPGGHTGHAPDLATALQQGGPVLNRKRAWAVFEADEERASLCKSLKVGECAFHGTVDNEA